MTEHVLLLTFVPGHKVNCMKILKPSSRGAKSIKFIRYVARFKVSIWRQNVVKLISVVAKEILRTLKLLQSYTADLFL